MARKESSRRWFEIVIFLNIHLLFLFHWISSFYIYIYIYIYLFIYLFIFYSPLSWAYFLFFFFWFCCVFVFFVNGSSFDCCGISLQCHLSAARELGLFIRTRCPMDTWPEDGNQFPSPLPPPLPPPIPIHFSTTTKIIIVIPSRH